MDIKKFMKIIFGTSSKINLFTFKNFHKSLDLESTKLLIFKLIANKKEIKLKINFLKIVFHRHIVVQLFLTFNSFNFEIKKKLFCLHL